MTEKPVLPIERAFELARSGKFSKVMDIRRRLSAEGYPVHQISGPTLKAQLRQMIQNALQGPPHPMPLTSNGTLMFCRSWLGRRPQKGRRRPQEQ
jgi:hypothetical protein